MNVSLDSSYDEIEVEGDNLVPADGGSKTAAILAVEGGILRGGSFVARASIFLNGLRKQNDGLI